ncbi:MAG: LEA type 2 family protein [Treponema sp.]|jgi:LEA14-like dessication related protein|nr:LEA type 2 family protein [Treponema sp.]
MNKRTPLYALAALVLLVICLSASSCRTLEAAFRQPVVSLRSVDIAGISLEEVQLLCSIGIENPNLVDLPFPEIDWEIFIGGASFLSGILSDGETIGPGTSRVLDIPLRLDYAALAGVAGTRAEIDYQIVLDLRFLLPVRGEWLVAFEHEGKLPLVRMISLRDPAFEVTSLDFNGMDLHFSLNVDNPNPFPIPFPDLSYTCEVRNNVYITGMAEHPEVLAAGSRNPVDITLRIVYADLYRSFSTLKSINEAACLLSLSTRVVLPGFGERRLSLDIPGTLPLLKTPDISFRGISVKNVSLSKIDFEFGWNLDNQNAYSFEAGDLEYEFLVNGAVWIEDRSGGTTKIGAGQKTVIVVAVTISSPSLVKELTDIITRGKDVDYQLSGSLTLSSGPVGFSGVSMPFDLSGRTRLRL